MAIARQIDPVPAGADRAPEALVRMGPVGRAMVVGWYLGLIAAAVADATLTGQFEAVLALAFVLSGTAAFLLTEGFTFDRAMARSLLVGSIGLVAGGLACLSSPSGTHAAASFLCFGAMAMLFGILATLPLALASTSTYR